LRHEDTFLLFSARVGMSGLQLGDAEIATVVDLDPFTLPLGLLFPDSDAAHLVPHRDWLEPLHMEGDRLHLAVQSIVIRVAGKVVLVDTCVGEDKNRTHRPDWHKRKATGYLDRLAAIGLSPEAVDYVLCTHLHGDHVGWNTRLVDGRWVPTFPNARYIMAQAEIDHWLPRAETANHGSAVDSVLPVIEAGRADFVAGDHEIAQGVVLMPLPGHTPGQVGLSLTRSGARALLVGDAIHHPVQLVAPEWSSAFCSDPDQARKTRRQLLESLAESDSWLLPTHFRAPTACRVRRCGNTFQPDFAP